MNAIAILTVTATTTATAAPPPTRQRRPRRPRSELAELKEPSEPKQKQRRITLTARQSRILYDELKTTTTNDNTVSVLFNRPITTSITTQVPLRTAVESNRVLTVLHSDIIEEALSYLTLFERKLTTFVCRYFKTLNGLLNPLCTRYHYHGLWTGIIDDVSEMKMNITPHISPEFVPFGLTKWVIDLNQRFTRKLSRSLDNNGIGCHYYLFRYIGKLCFNALYKSHDMESFIASIHHICDTLEQFKHVLSSLTWLDLDCNLQSPSVIKPINKSTWTSQCTSCIIRLFYLLSSSPLSTTLRMFTLWIGDAYEVMNVIVLLHHLPPSIEYLHLIPYCNPIYRTEIVRQTTTTTEYTLSDIMAIDDLRVNPHISSLVLTCPTLHTHVKYSLIDDAAVDSDYLHQMYIKRGWLDLHTILALKQLPNLKALWLTHAPTYSWRLVSETIEGPPIYCLYHSLTSLTVNAGIYLYDIAWLPFLKQLRCGAIYPSKTELTKKLEFPSLQTMELSVIQGSDQEYNRWWEYFLTTIEHHVIRTESIAISMVLHSHPDIVYTKPNAIFVRSCMQPLISMHNVEDVLVASTKARYHGQNESGVLLATWCIDSLFNNNLDETNTKNQIAYRHTQHSIGVSFKHKNQNDAKVPECFHLIPHDTLEEHKQEFIMEQGPYTGELPSAFQVQAEPVDWVETEHQQEQARDRQVIDMTMNDLDWVVAD